MTFKNREDAGNLLAEKLEKYKQTDAVVLTIPRGGVPLAYKIAKKLNLPLDIVLSKKIGHPMHKEFAIGAVTLKTCILSDAASEIPKEYIKTETQRIRELLQKRYDYYYEDIKPLPLKDKVLIIVDDGIATGNTMISIINLLYYEKPKKIIVAIPVASPSSIKKLKNSPFIDEIICILAPVNFRSVGQFYENFDQGDDLQVYKLLNKSRSILS